MTNIIGSGVGNLGPWYVLANAFTVTDASGTSFSVTNSIGNLIVSGTGFTYAGATMTGGTVTDIQYSRPGPSGGAGGQHWTGLSVSAAAAFNALAANDLAGFEALFLGGDDTFNWYSPTLSTVFTAGLYGFGGDDTFNVSAWNLGGSVTGWTAESVVDGGTGVDTLNVSGGIFATSPTLPNFNVTNVERVNLAAGANYEIFAYSTLVFAGRAMTIDASALGAANSLNFHAASDFSSSTILGDITLIGGAGNDVFQGGAGNNVFNGGAGSDTVDFYVNALGYNGPGVTASLNISGPQSIGGPRGGTVSFNSIENLTGTIYSDTLTGDNGNNILDAGGGQGNDTLNGLGGDDTLIVDRGLNANDLGTLNGGSGYDTVILPAAPQFYTISHSGHTVTISGIGTYTLTDVESAIFQGQRVQLAGPVITPTPPTLRAGQTVALSSLFSATDILGDTITQYQLWDSTRDPNSGYFVVGGQAKAAGTIVDITAAQLAQTSFVTGSVGDSLQIRAFDGTSWSAADNAAWAPFAISPQVNHAPVLQTSNWVTGRSTTITLSDLIFSLNDADGDAITRYQLWDGSRDPNSGHFEINSVAQAAGTIIDVTAAQLAQTTFVTGKLGDSLQIRAYDGALWSAADTASWAPFTVTVPDAAPAVSTNNVSKTHFQTTALSGLFSVTDADGDAMTRYQLWDSTRDPNSGHFEINGVAQAAGTIIDVSAAQLAQTTFVAGTVNDDLQIRAFDGIAWSAADNASWSAFTVSVPAYTAPHVTTGPVNAAIGQTIALSSLITVSDADGDTTTRYQLWDSTANPLSGHWVVGGQTQAAGTVIDITAAQLGQTSFVAGRVNDNLQVRAFDGRSWSDADNAAWAPFTVSVPTNHAPVLTTTPQLSMHARLMPLSGLFSISDADSDTMTRYQLWDSSRDPNSGHWQVNGVAQAAGTVIDVTAAQLAQTFFVAGISVSDSLQIRAFDGLDWSDGDNAAWQPFSVTVATPYTAPIVNTNDVNTTAAQTLALSSLMSVSDPDGDSMTRYQLWDSTGDPNSGHFVVNGVAKSASTVIDITSAQFAQTSFLTGTLGDSLQIRAFDGVSWSAADNASWSPFHINVS
jgi:Ca2+-binding RTX toxin-like protein